MIKKPTTIEWPISANIVFDVFLSPKPTTSPAKLIPKAMIVITAKVIRFSPKSNSFQSFEMAHNVYV